MEKNEYKNYQHYLEDSNVFTGLMQDLYETKKVTLTRVDIKDPNIHSLAKINAVQDKYKDHYKVILNQIEKNRRTLSIYDETKANYDSDARETRNFIYLLAIGATLFLAFMIFSSSIRFPALITAVIVVILILTFLFLYIRGTKMIKKEAKEYVKIKENMVNDFQKKYLELKKNNLTLAEYTSKILASMMEELKEYEGFSQYYFDAPRVTEILKVINSFYANTLSEAINVIEINNHHRRVEEESARRTELELARLNAQVSFNNARQSALNYQSELLENIDKNLEKQTDIIKEEARKNDPYL